MNDKITWEVETQYTSTGAERELQTLRKHMSAVDADVRAGNLSLKQGEALTKSYYRQEQALRGASSSTQTLSRATAETARHAGNVDNSFREVNNTLDRSNEGFVALRYSLYDVGRTSLTASAAIAGVGVAAVTAFGSQERAFTEVERIAEGSLQEVQYLRKELQDMSTEIPRSFQELSEIASLGGALGIDAPSLDEFTETVAKFVTLTGITEEAATTGFGRISQYLEITAEDYDKLGSAILRAGNISVATEEQVLKFSSAISLPAARAGLLADEVVALGAATASFANINVEGAGSAFSRVFANIERAVSEGGESLDKFAAASGYSSEQFKVAWGSDAGGTFNRIIQGLSQNVDGLVGNLDTLGIRNERDRRVVSALALNYQEYMRIVGETTNAWREGIYMNEAYGLVLDDLVSKWTIFQNALTNAAAAIGAEIAPAVKGLLDIATDLLVKLAEFAETPFGGVLTRVAAAAAAMSVAVLGIVGVLAVAGGSALAFRFALQQLYGSGILSGLTSLRSFILGIGTASTTSAAGVGTLNGALATTGAASTTAAAGTGGLATNLGKLAKGGGAVGGVLLLASAFTDLRGTVTSFLDMSIYLAENLQWLSNWFNAPIAAVFGLAEAFGWMDTTAAATASRTIDMAEVFAGAGNLINNVASSFVAVLTAMVNTAQRWAIALSNAALVVGRTFGGVISSVISGLSDLSRGLSIVLGPFAKGFANGLEIMNNATTSSLRGLRKLAENLPGLDSAGTDLGNSFQGAAQELGDFGDIADDAGDSAEEAAKKIYTLVDYANDLSSVWKRAFDIRFGSEASMDQITASWQRLRDAAEESARKVRDLRTAIQGLNADSQSLTSEIGILEYYKSIALAYEDFTRAAALDADLAKKRAELAKVSDDLSDRNSDLRKEIASQSKTTEGNSEVARDNRAALRELVTQYQEQIQKLAESGMSQDMLARKTQELRQQFIAQATQLGYNRTEVLRYAESFNDVAVAIANVPRNITVTANVDPAIQALNEFKARADQANNSLSNLRNNASAGVPSAGIPNLAAGAPQTVARLEAVAQVVRLTALVADAIANRNVVAAAVLLPQLAQWRVRAVEGWQSGGYTGAGPANAVAGQVHRGEYVIPKSDVNQSTGLPYADALGRLMGGAPSRSVAPAASSGSSGAATVALSAGTIQAIAQAVPKYLVLDGKLVAEATSQAFAKENTVGAY